MHQFFVNNLQMEIPLQGAASHPRIHVDTSGDIEQLMAEHGLDLPDMDIPVRMFPKLNMYFGGVGAASFDTKTGFEVAADPRREGGIHVYDG
jgi:gamma-glutamyltranspeptidase